MIFKYNEINMKKIIWLSNVVFSDEKIKRTASWLQPMVDLLNDKKIYNIKNITISNVSQVQHNYYNGIEQWIIPTSFKNKYNQLASKETCELVENIINNEQPDLVHIWGTENVWASIHQKGYIKYKTLLDIQGLLFAYSDFYYGGLTFREIIKSIHIKELIMPWRTLFFKNLIFKKRGEIELNTLNSFIYISVQSKWVENNLSLKFENKQYFYKPVMLRSDFFSHDIWQYKSISDNPVIFSSCSAAVTYKGLHVLIKAVAALKIKYPNIQLRLAGLINVGNYLLDGYSVFLNNLIDELGLKDNVIFVGSLNSNEMAAELQKCNVCVVPSFIETYCVAFAEAMLLGVPVVTAFSGAMPELANNNKEAIFYTPIDHVACASAIDRLIIDKEMAEYISKNARSRRLIESNQEYILNLQLDMYESILDY